jgi:uncharacterized protein YndB with AHSA1/START domain
MPKSSPVAKRIGFMRTQSYRSSLKDVWEAATEAKHLNRFFTSGAKGNIAADLKPVTWKWKGFGSAKLTVMECEPLKSCQFRWKAPGNDETLVRFEFSRYKRRTIVHVYEAGWKPERLDRALDNCGGWSEWLYGLKAYVDYGIDLRK